MPQVGVALGTVKSAAKVQNSGKAGACVATAVMQLTCWARALLYCKGTRVLLAHVLHTALRSTLTEVPAHQQIDTGCGWCWLQVTSACCVTNISVSLSFGIAR